MTTIDFTKPMFPYAEQSVVISENFEFIGMMRSSKDIQEWNLNRQVIKGLLKRTNYRAYIMLMGYIDSTVFPQTFNLKKR